MTLIIIIGSIVAYLTFGAFVCGLYDDFLYVERYIYFWPVMIVINFIEKIKEK